MGYLGTPIDTNNTFQSLQGKRFSGNGSATAFTLDVAPTSTFDIEVFVENVRQDPNSAYSLSGVTLTFAAAPGSGTNNIYVIHQAKAVGTISAGEGTVQASSFSNDVISGHTALAATPADTDEFLVSDAGTIKRIDYSLIKGSSNTPAFSTVSSGDQSIAHDTFTKVVFGTEILDSNGKFANNRFTPTVAGYYQLTTGTKIAGVDSAEIAQITFYKNGSDYQYGKHYHQGNDSNGERFLSTSVLMYLDSDDYVEVFVYHNEGGAQNAQAANTFFTGFRIIGV